MATTQQMALLFGGPTSRVLQGTRCVIFDAVTKEETTISSKITKHPIQTGSPANDHVTLENERFSFKVYVSNEPVYESDRNLILYGEEYVRNVFGSTTADNVGFSSKYNTFRSKYAYDLLKALWEKKELITINIAHDTIENCAIEKIVFTESTYNELSADITVVKLNFIEEETQYIVERLKPDVQEQKNKGNTTPIDAKEDTYRLPFERWKELKRSSKDRMAEDKIPSEYER